MWTCLRCGNLTTDDENRFCVNCGSARSDHSASRYSIYLMDIDLASKIHTIKIVREMTSLGLKEAKDLVEHTPQPLATNLSREEADMLGVKLRDVGAQVEVLPLGTPPSRTVAPLPAPRPQATTGCTGLMFIIGCTMVATTLLVNWLAHLR